MLLRSRLKGRPPAVDRAVLEPLLLQVSLHAATTLTWPDKLWPGYSLLSSALDRLLPYLEPGQVLT